MVKVRVKVMVRVNVKVMVKVKVRVKVMTRRDLKDQTFLQIAQLLGQLGTCDRAQVGALIVKDGRCVSWGYNGAPPGLPHCEESSHGWLELSRVSGALGGSNRRTWIDWQLKVKGCIQATHAEINAVAFAARQGISTDDATLYISIEACRDCARALIAAGIVRVVAASEYPRNSGTELLRQAGVDVSIAALDDIEP